MPLVHIHSPQQSIELPSLQVAVSINPLEYVYKLRHCGATADILEPEFSGDITPEISGKTDLYAIKVDQSGEKALFTLGQSAVGVLSGIRPTLTFFETISGGNGFRIPEDGETLPLIWEETNPLLRRQAYKYKVGGLITSALDTPSGAQGLVDNFRKHNPR